MDGCYSPHGSSFGRRFCFNRLTTMSVCFVLLLAFHLANVQCATLQKAPDKNVEDAVPTNGNRTFRQTPFNFVNPSLIAHTPASFGFPLYPTQVSSLHINPYHQFVTTVNPQRYLSSDKVKAKDKEIDTDFEVESKSQDDSKKATTKTKKEKRKKEKLKVEEKAAEKEGSKNSDAIGTKRACPACIGGECDPHLDPGVNISGIPIIQIIIAGLVGAVWAGVFLFILFNFIENDSKKQSGGYDTPAYGAPVAQYGAPHSEYGAPQSEYGSPQTEYGTPQQDYGSPSTYDRIANRYGRSSNPRFNQLSDWVSDAIDKLIKLYGEKGSE